MAPSWEAPVWPTLRARLLGINIEVLIAFWRKPMESPGLEEVLPTMSMPCPLVAGEVDCRDGGAKPCVTGMPHVTFVS
jgi:hypothetical protein